MTIYRVFMLGKDDHILGSKVIDCPTDDEAITRAPDFGGMHKAVEVGNWLAAWDASICGSLPIPNSRSMSVNAR